MIATEDEAKTRWCPFARYDDNACNRWHTLAHRDPDTNEQFAPSENTNPEPCRCIASACMAWQIVELAEHDAETGQEIHPERGGCGLAGATP